MHQEKNLSFRDYQVYCTYDGDDTIEEVLGSFLFLNWLNSLDSSLHLQSIYFQFTEKDPIKKEYIFIKADTLCIRNGAKIQRYIFLQGPLISILLQLITNEEPKSEFTLFTEKPFIATGKTINTTLQFHYSAQITSEDIANFCSQEIGLIFDVKNIKNISELMGKTELYPLGGSSDCNVTVYLATIHINQTMITSLEGKHGLIHPELIFHIYPIENCFQKSHDSITLASVSLFNHMN